MEAPDELLGVEARDVHLLGQRRPRVDRDVVGVAGSASMKRSCAATASC